MTSLHLDCGHPAQWMAAVGALSVAPPGATLSWPEIDHFGGPAELTADLQNVADAAVQRAHAWLSSPWADITDVPGDLDTWAPWVDQIATHARTTGEHWLHDTAERLAAYGSVPPRINYWWAVEPDEDLNLPGELDPRYQAIDNIESRHRRTVRRSRLRFGTGRASFGRAAARTARTVVDAPDLVADALRTDHGFTGAIRTGLRWSGHTGLDWLAVCGIAVAPRWLLTNVYRYPVWPAPLTLDVTRSLCEQAEALEITDRGNAPIWPPVIARLWAHSGIVAGLAYRSGRNNGHAVYYEWAGYSLMAPTVPPVGAAELVTMLGVARATVDSWRQRGVLPRPDHVIGGRPAWDQSTIERWALSTGRRPAAPAP